MQIYKCFCWRQADHQGPWTFCRVTCHFDKGAATDPRMIWNNLSLTQFIEQIVEMFSRLSKTRSSEISIYETTVACVTLTSVTNNSFFNASQRFEPNLRTKKSHGLQSVLGSIAGTTISTRKTLLLAVNTFGEENQYCIEEAVASR